MPNGSAAIVQKLWNYCNILRDDGLSYGDYVEQLTYLLFLKMAHEQTLPPFNRPAIVSEDYNWASLLDVEGDALEIHYRHVPGEPRPGEGPLGRHLPEGPEQNPGSRQAAAADRRPDRPRAVDDT